MRNFATANMIEGVGVYIDSSSSNVNTPPSFDECREMIAERAYQKWLQSGGQPGHDLEDWLQAEAELFCGLHTDGYDVYVCDLSRRENKGFFRYWDSLHITPQGVVRN
jgi:hypothetical protein